jgi:hypothetical protein
MNESTSLRDRKIEVRRAYPIDRADSLQEIGNCQLNQLLSSATKNFKAH